MNLTIKQLNAVALKNGNKLGILNSTGTLMEFEQIRLTNGFIFRVVKAYHKSSTDDEYQTFDTLKDLTYSSEKVTLFDNFMRAYTQEVGGRIMHTINPKNLIDGGFHGYSRNN